MDCDRAVNANIKALAAELQISRQALYRWKGEVEGNAGRKRSAASSSAFAAELRKEIASPDAYDFHCERLSHLVYRDAPICSRNGQYTRK